MRHIECSVCKEVLTTEPIEALPYAITKGDKSVWDDTSSNLTITANGDLDKFVKLSVDDSVVDPSNYDLVSGSTIATLKHDFLKTLAVGKHKIVFVYTNGQTEGSFEVKDTEPVVPVAPIAPIEDERIVDTSDNNSIGLWIVLMAVNGSFALLIKKYR